MLASYNIRKSPAERRMGEAQPAIRSTASVACLTKQTEGRINERSWLVVLNIEVAHPRKRISNDRWQQCFQPAPADAAAGYEVNAEQDGHLRQAAVQRSEKWKDDIASETSSQQWHE
jgi:hypothetical protein